MKNVLALVFVFFSTSVFASMNPNALAAKMSQLREDFEVKDQKQRLLQSQLFQVEKRLKKISDEHLKLSANLASIKSSTRASLNILKDLDDKIKSEKILLSKRLDTIVKVYYSSLKDILIFSKNPNQIERNMKGMQFFIQKDIRLLKDYSRNVAQFSVEQRQLKEKIQSLTKVKEDLKPKVLELEKLKNDQTALVLLLKKQKSQRLAQLEDLRKEGKRWIQQASIKQEERDLLQRLVAKSFFESKYNLAYPTKGKIVRHYGPYEYGEDKIKLFSKGIFLETTETQTAFAVGEGMIVYRGNLPGYAATLVIDHGHKYYTVYANLRNVYVKVNDYVSLNQPLGEIDWNPQTQQSGLYFEIRHFSDALNPEEWFLPSQKQFSKIDNKNKVE